MEGIVKFLKLFVGLLIFALLLGEATVIKADDPPKQPVTTPPPVPPPPPPDGGDAGSSPSF